MATPTIQQGRLITKRSAIPGTVPTVPAVDDIETFTPTDIFKGELFYNIPDNILYTRDNTGIIIISSGGAPIPYIYYTENTGVGTEDAKIEVTDGIYTSTQIIKPREWSFYHDDSGNIVEGSLDSDGPTDYIIKFQETTPSQTLIFGTKYSNQFNVYTTDGTNTSELYVSAPGFNINVTDGVNSGNLGLDMLSLISTITDGTNTSTQNTTSNSITSTSTDGTNTSTTQVVPTNVNLNSTDSTNDCIIDMGFNVLSISSNQITNDIVSQIYLDPANLASVNGTYIRTEELSTGDYSQIKISNSSIILESSDGTNTTEFSQTPTSFKISGIGSYASDAAAGTAGLVAGNVYQTDGTGSGIFATPGILMIKQ